jgi:hypothetical protein
MCMEVFSKEFQIGNLKIELSVEESHGCSKVIFTARDEEDRRIWRTPIMDLNGDIKMYNSQEEAITDAERKLGTV